MPLSTVDATHRAYEMVKVIEITIGEESVKHHFGRSVSMHTARKYAQHYLDVMTGSPSTFAANVKEES